MNYNTGVQVTQPVTPEMQAAAQAGLQQQAIRGYPGPAMDVYRGAAQRKAVDMERYAAGLNNQQLLNAQQAQQAMALQGLQNLSQQQQNANNYANESNSVRLGYAGKMLGGLNGLLTGLFN